MTFLELINQVLMRLREDTIDSAEFGSDPYYNYIGSAVNDAKVAVEQAWQWSALRDHFLFPYDSNTQPEVVGATYAVPESADNDFVMKDFSVIPNTSGNVFFPDGHYAQLRQVTQAHMRNRYRDPNNIARGQPAEWCYNDAVLPEGGFYPDSFAGRKLIVVWPAPTNESGVGDYWARMRHWKRQAPLVAHTDKLIVPSLPVYSLATALASRERGEVGGTPTQELLMQADKYLSDAIAYDSALISEEMDWWANTREDNTNVRFA